LKRSPRARERLDMDVQAGVPHQGWFLAVHRNEERAPPAMKRMSRSTERLDMDVQAGAPHQGWFLARTFIGRLRTALKRSPRPVERLGRDVQAGALHQGRVPGDTHASAPAVAALQPGSALRIFP
jgi:hypothetical protein